MSFKFDNRAGAEFMEHVRSEVQAMAALIPISLEMYSTMAINSYEAKFLEPYLSDEAFVWKLENAIKNARHLTQYELARHYDEYLSTDGVAELLKRFKARR